MSTHSPHPPILEHGLADGCERCEEIAQDPFASLDDANLGIILALAQDGSRARSHNEWVAMQEVETVLIRYRRLQRLGVEL